MIIDHIGIVVESIEGYLEKSMYKKCSPIVFDEVQQAEICFLRGVSPKLELIEPKSEESKVYNFLENYGGGLHHICYRVKTIKDALEKIDRNNMIKVFGPVKAEAFSGRRVVFAYTRNKELIEFIEKGGDKNCK